MIYWMQLKKFLLFLLLDRNVFGKQVDRSVTGLVAQQQAVGSCQVPISNYSLVAQSYFGYTGIVTAVESNQLKN